jgi:hypothetical protein
MSFTFHGPLIRKLTHLFSNKKLKITLSLTNTILNKLRTLTNINVTKHPVGIYQMRWQTCKVSHIALRGLNYNSDTDSTFAISHLTLHSHPMPITFLTVNIYTYQLYYNDTITTGAITHTHESFTKPFQSIIPT